MSSIRVAAAVAVLCLTAAGLSSCVVKRRIITRIGAKGKQSVLLTAQAPELVRRIADQYNRIRDFNATVDMTPALGTAEKGRITEYKDVRGYILFRKPADIRIIGLYPLVRNTAFDMVSTGPDFKLYLPSQNRFIVGANTVRQRSKNKLENLRPQHFLDSLLVTPVESTAKVLLENYTDEDNAFYILHVIHEGNGGELVLSRTIWFNRLDLRLARQIVLDPEGNIVSDSRYADWREYNKVPFPRHVEINRPIDEYGVVLDVQKMDINKGVSDDKFVLRQPQGSKLQQLGESPASADQSVRETGLR